MWIINYFVLSAFCFLGAGYYLYRFLRVPLQNTRPDENNNDGGGWNDDSGLPVIDLPPGCTLNDLLTDRFNNRDAPSHTHKIGR